jgi:hypothetical protein
MTTFVLKAESEVILNTEAKESKLELLAGKVWVNVKKMVKDGEMNIEMSQAVAGIKGTNITCSSSSDKTENRVKVLRGRAKVTIRDSQEEHQLNEGEELVIKKGAKPEKNDIDIDEEQKDWKEETSKIGSSIPLDEIPETIRHISEGLSQEMTRIKDEFQRLLELDEVDEEVAAELQKEAERFIGIILEGDLVLANLKKKIDKELSKENLVENDRMVLAGLSREIAALVGTLQSYREQAARVMRYKFKLSALFEDISSEVEIVLNQLGGVTAEVDNIQAEISNDPNGNSQDWFLESIETLQEKLQDLEEILQNAQELVERNPQDQSAQNLIKQVSTLQNNIGNMMKDLSVVEISPATITELQQIDDILSDQMVVLQDEIAAYNSIDSSTYDVSERRLQASLRIMDNYARVRRNYLSAQRLYDATMRSTQGAKFRTSEQEEVETLWQNVSDRFQQLGIVADELQSNIEHLESQLQQWLH